MKPFTFPLDTLLKVKKHHYEKDVHHLALLQKELHLLLERKNDLQEMFEEMIDASPNEPAMRGGLAQLREKIEHLDQEIILIKKKIIESQKILCESFRKRKVIEKIRENQYALYQKECVRINERQNSAMDRAP